MNLTTILAVILFTSLTFIAMFVILYNKS